MQEESMGKSPLASTTIQTAAVGLLAAIVGQFYPPVGDWLKAHTPEVLGAVSAVAGYGRHKASEPIDWKNWTVGGVGLKF